MLRSPQPNSFVQVSRTKLMQALMTLVPTILSPIPRPSFQEDGQGSSVYGREAGDR